MTIAKSDLTADQINLLRETGIVVITTVTEASDADVTAETVEEVVDQVVELGRL